MVHRWWGHARRKSSPRTISSIKNLLYQPIEFSISILQKYLMKLILSHDCKPRMWLAHLCSNLVAALAGLDVDNLPHGLVVACTSGAVAGRQGSEEEREPHPPKTPASFPEQPTATPCHLYSTGERFKLHKIHSRQGTNCNRLPHFVNYLFQKKMS